MAKTLIPFFLILALVAPMINSRHHHHHQHNHHGHQHHRYHHHGHQSHHDQHINRQSPPSNSNQSHHDQHVNRQSPPSNRNQSQHDQHVNQRSPPSNSNQLFDVTQYGARGDGHADDTKAFEGAWDAACNSGASGPTLYVPSGRTFLIKATSFRGQCKSERTTFKIDGTIVAPDDPSSWEECRGKDTCKYWLSFHGVDGLFIQGSGTINGQGSRWWDHSLCHRTKIGCEKKPTGLTIENCNNVHLSSITFEDSPQMHIAVERSTGVYISNLHIRAPQHSPNTDGIHLQHSKNVSIDDLHIGTGDDCISIGDGTSYLKINNIECGPGHGISVGSLGKHGDREIVEHVHVQNVVFRDTMNGARIKTWQGGRGYARDITFENIISHGSSRPIIIDQHYCDHEQCHDQTSAVQISNVTFRNINGTSNAETAVTLDCSKYHPCENIVMKDVNLGLTKDGSQTTSYCNNVRGARNRNIMPRVSCLRENNHL